MDMILFKVRLESIDLIPQQQILQRQYLHNYVILDIFEEDTRKYWTRNKFSKILGK